MDISAAAGSSEITVLGWSAILLLVQVILQAGSASDLGPTYLFSPRDEERKSSSVVANRLDRALKNLLETYPAFIALAAALAITGKTGGVAATGAWIYLICRVAYVVIYAAGIPVVRTLVWLVSIIGLILMAARLLW